MVTTSASTAAATRVGPVTATHAVETLVVDAARDQAAFGSGSDGRGDGPWDEAWARALDALELDVDQVEQDLVHAHLVEPDALGPVVAWEPPSDLGPLPASLRERAQAVLDRQLDVARRTAEALVASRRHAQAAQALRPRQIAVPVYLDTDA